MAISIFGVAEFCGEKHRSVKNRHFGPLSAMRFLPVLAGPESYVLEGLRLPSFLIPEATGQ